MYIINKSVIIIVIIFLISMIYTLKRGIQSDLHCLTTFSFFLCKKQYSVIISLGFRQHVNLSLSPCFISLLFWSSQIVVSIGIFITSNQRFVKWHNHKINELICCNIWERGLINLHRVVIGPVCVLCAVCAEQHCCTTESIQTNVLWPFFKYKSQPPWHVWWWIIPIFIYPHSSIYSAVDITLNREN